MSFCSCNVNAADALDLTPHQVQLTRSQNIYTQCLGLKFEQNMRHYIPEIEQLTQYTIVLSLQNQHGRFVFKSVMVNYKNKTQKSRLRVKSEETCQVV